MRSLDLDPVLPVGIDEDGNRFLDMMMIACLLEEDGETRRVAIIGRPVARKLDDGYTAEITRCCTDGVSNGCSMLYGAAVRACRALGFHSVITYTLQSETGASLKASNWKLEEEVAGQAFWKLSLIHI